MPAPTIQQLRIYYERSGQMMMVAFTGQTWLSPIQVVGSASGEPPGFVVVAGQLQMLQNSSNSLVVSGSSDGRTFTKISETAGARMWGAPSPVIAPDGSTVVAYNNRGRHLGSSVRKVGGAFSTPATAKNVGITDIPSAVVFQGALSAFHQGDQSDGELYAVTWTGGAWPKDGKINGITLTGAPAAAVYNGTLYVFHQSKSHGGWLYYCAYDGSNWTGDIPVDDASGAGAGLTGSPTATVFGGRLFVLHQGRSSNGELWFTSFNGTTWTKDVQVLPNVATIDGNPTAVVF